MLKGWRYHSFYVHLTERCVNMLENHCLLVLVISLLAHGWAEIGTV